MTRVSANIFQGKPNLTIGGLMAAPAGTALPTDITTAPNAAFKDLGAVTEGGFVLSQDLSIDKIRDWNGDQMRAVLQEFTGTVSVSFLETTAEVLKAVYGAAQVTTVATIGTPTTHTIRLGAFLPPVLPFVANILDDVRAMRVVIPKGQITSRNDMSFTRNEAVEHGGSIDCFPDASGVSIYIYTSDGVNVA
ncbi:MAG TPA: hypothetical protein PLB92_00060 [Rhodoglobus sp.]|nr:hypothetical protein [Rhodoglobus sp.]